MEANLSKIKALIAACFATLGAFLGWRGVMAIVWVAVMALDYISGTLAARKKGEWTSKRAREGLWHKCGMVFAVIVSGLADLVISLLLEQIPGDVLPIHWPCLVFPLVLAWYIITELGSILENAISLGAAVPTWLVKLLDATLKAVDKSGNTAADENYKSGE